MDTICIQQSIAVFHWRHKNIFLYQQQMPIYLMQQTQSEKFCPPLTNNEWYFNNPVSKCSYQDIKNFSDQLNDRILTIKQITRRHSESAYIHQVHDNVMMYMSTHLHKHLPSNVVDASPANDNDVIDNAGVLWCHWRVRKNPSERWNGVDIFVNFFTTPISILNLTMSSESQENDIFNDILSERKYSQLFTHESNIFLLKQLSCK